MNSEPEKAAAIARQVREAASRSGAVPLVESADRILDRLELREARLSTRD
jgi:hypothetical protein